jgi:hypothetical protein
MRNENPIPDKVFTFSTSSCGGLAVRGRATYYFFTFKEMGGE